MPQKKHQPGERFQRKRERQEHGDPYGGRQPGNSSDKNAEKNFLAE